MGTRREKKIVTGHKSTDEREQRDWESLKETRTVEMGELCDTWYAVGLFNTFDHLYEADDDVFTKKVYSNDGQFSQMGDIQ